MLDNRATRFLAMTVVSGFFGGCFLFGGYSTAAGVVALLFGIYMVGEGFDRFIEY